MAFRKSEALSRLKAAYEAGRLGHAYLIVGPKGSGKSELVKELAASILNTPLEKLTKHPDFHHIQPESKSRRILTDKMRSLEHAMRSKPLMGTRKVAFIFEADRMQPEAANAFLKTLEEPPPGSHLFLLSSMPNALLDTITSRCITVPLFGELDPTSPSPTHEKLITTLETLVLDEPSAVTAAFHLSRLFAELLTQERALITDQFAKALKQEAAIYKEIADDRWLKNREEQNTAMAEAAALRYRSEFLQIILAWFADVLRIQHGSPALNARSCHLDAARRFSTKTLLLQVNTLDALRSNLERNAHETLTLEAGFLKLFSQRAS